MCKVEIMLASCIKEPVSAAFLTTPCEMLYRNEFLNIRLLVNHFDAFDQINRRLAFAEQVRNATESYFSTGLTAVKLDTWLEKKLFHRLLWIRSTEIIINSRIFLSRPGSKIIFKILPTVVKIVYKPFCWDPLFFSVNPCQFQNRFAKISRNFCDSRRTTQHVSCYQRQRGTARFEPVHTRTGY